MFADSFIEGFLEETREILERLETDLLSLESDPSNMDIISSVFRSFHTIKGSAAMFGFEEISRFTHYVEDLLDRARSRKLEITNDMISVILMSKDHIQEMLDSTEKEEMVKKSDLIIAKVKVFLKDPNDPFVAPQEEPQAISTPEPEPTKSSSALPESTIELMKAMSSMDESEEIDTGAIESDPALGQMKNMFYIYFQPNEDFLYFGGRPARLIDEIRGVSENLYIKFYTDKIKPITKNESELLNVYWRMYVETENDKNFMQEIFIFVNNISRIIVQDLSPEFFLNEDEGIADLNDFVHAKYGKDFKKMYLGKNPPKPVKKQDPKPVVVTPKVTAEVKPVETPKPAPAPKAEAPKPVETAPAPKTEAKPTPKPVEAKDKEDEKKPKGQKQQAAQTSIRVSSDKLDSLVDMVGELVTVHARIKQTAEEKGDVELESVTENLERLVNDMRDLSMTMRMMPIGSTFDKFKRLVRDLSGELGKQVEVVTEGAETELDKTVIEKINEPLIHIIRNSMDHGIETPERRLEKGKDEKGTIKISAHYSGASVLISIEDDGNGINKDAVREKAIEKGIISPDATLTDEEIYAMIFANGFSTAKEITSVSGRGVGMDVVRKEIESLRGKVTVSSELGKGTRITLILPLTLAIIDGLLIKIEDDYYTIPLGFIDSCIDHENKTDDKELQKQMLKQGRSIISYRGEFLPYVSIRELFQYDTVAKQREQIVVVNTKNGKTGFVVDRVIGEYQTVIKNLGDVYSSAEGYTGASILGDGNISLILDVDMLSDIILKRESIQNKILNANTK